MAKKQQASGDGEVGSSKQPYTRHNKDLDPKEEALSLDSNRLEGNDTKRNDKVEKLLLKKPSSNKE